LTKVKKIIGYVAISLSVIAVATGAFRTLYPSPNLTWAKETHGLLYTVARWVESDGIRPDLNDFLASSPGPKNWLATVVFRQVESDEVKLTGQAVAASNQHLIGLTDDEVFERLRDKGGRLIYVSEHFSTPDETPHWVAAYGIPQYITGYTWLIGPVLLFSGIGAWLGIAAWVVMDVRERQKVNTIVWSWALLALVTGPVALGVWLISRQSLTKTGPVFCPSCGSTVPEEAAYCVQCGHPVLPLCPKCGKRVGLEWAYCGSCGTFLAEET
jgi:hypothetical protein